MDVKTKNQVAVYKIKQMQHHQFTIKPITFIKICCFVLLLVLNLHLMSNSQHNCCALIYFWFLQPGPTHHIIVMCYFTFGYASGYVWVLCLTRYQKTYLI
jgi:hypothetical protein